MSKQIIVDYIPFEISREQINESINENNGRLIVNGVLQRAESKNQNGRVYPKDILVRESKKYTAEFLIKFLEIFCVVGTKTETNTICKIVNNREIFKKK